MRASGKVPTNEPDAPSVLSEIKDTEGARIAATSVAMLLQSKGTYPREENVSNGVDSPQVHEHVVFRLRDEVRRHVPRRCICYVSSTNFVVGCEARPPKGSNVMLTRVAPERQRYD